MNKIFIILFTFFTSILHSQTLSPNVISSSGKCKNVNGIVLSYTIGQAYHSTLINRAVLTQGFQQNIILKSKKKTEEKKITLSIFPNPVKNVLNINIENDIIESFFLEIYNIKGNKIVEKYINKNYMTVNFSVYPKGEYIIKIFSDQNSNKYVIYKVIHL